jgi:hypothetical protein
MDERVESILNKLDDFIDDLDLCCNHPEIGWPDPVAQAGINTCIERLRSYKHAIVEEAKNIADIYRVSDKRLHPRNKDQ